MHELGIPGPLSHGQQERRPQKRCEPDEVIAPCVRRTLRLQDASARSPPAQPAQVTSYVA